MMLEPQSLIVWLVIGLIAGWLAGQIVKGYGFGLVGNLVVGVVGAFIGGWLLGLLNIHYCRVFQTGIASDPNIARRIDRSRRALARVSFASAAAGAPSPMHGD